MQLWVKRMQHDLEGNQHSDDNQQVPAQAPLEFHESEEHDDFEAHVDEKWLVSYADLMTLLFGLFVMLYVLTLEKKGNIQEQFQQISEQMSGKPLTQKPPEESVKPPQQYTDEQYVQLYQQSEAFKQRLEEMMAELEQLKAKPEALPQLHSDQQYEELLKEANELRQQIEAMNEELEELRSRPEFTSDIDQEEFNKLQNELKTNIQKLADAQTEIKNLNKNIEQLNATVLGLNKDIEALNTKIVALNKDIEELNIEKKQMQDEIAQFKKDIKRLTAQIEDLEIEKKDLVAENKAQKTKISELEKKLKNMVEKTSETLAEKTNIEKDLKKMKTETAAKDKEIKKLDAVILNLNTDMNRTDNLVAKAARKIKELEMKNKQLNAQKAEMDASMAQMRAADLATRAPASLSVGGGIGMSTGTLSIQEQAKLQRDLAEFKRKNAELTKSLNEVNKKLENSLQVQNNYLMISTSWNTDKHDIDLKVKDPSGTVYTYKAARKPDAVGEFIMDSRTGPGMEAWRSVKFTPGEYEVSVEFYNNYGNDAPASVRLVAATNTGQFELAVFDLDFVKDKTKTLKFRLDSAGNVIK